RLRQPGSRQARTPGDRAARSVARHSRARPARAELAHHPGPSLAGHPGLGGARGGEKLQSGPCVVSAAGGNAAALSRTVGVVVLLYRSWGAFDRAGPERAAAQLGPARPRPGTSPAGLSRPGTDAGAEGRLALCPDSLGTGAGAL